MQIISEQLLRLKSYMSTWLQDDSQNIDIARAQFVSTSRQAPYLYIIRFLCAWTIALTQLGVAPLWLVLGYPILSSYWAFKRIKLLRSKNLKIPDTLPALKAWRKRTQRIALIAPSVFTIWALTLFPFGSTFSQVQIFLTILVANFSALFSLTHLRSIAVINAVSSTVLYAAFFTWYGDPSYQLMALFGVVTTFFASMIEVNTYRDFVSLITTGKELRDQKQHLEAKQLETERLSALNYQIANTDNLTGIANRRCFRETLEQEFNQAVDAGQGFSLCIFDIGGLKSLNEVYGLDAGDQVLKEIADRLKKIRSQNVFVGRVAGDEFGFFARCCSDELHRIKETFMELVEQPIELKQGEIRPDFSAGIAEYSPSVKSATDLLERANFALLAAKQNNNDLTVVFDHVLDAERARTSDILKALQSPSLKDELSLAYQPIVNVHTNSVLAVECLARWYNPELGSVSPAQFIPLAEKSGIINQISLDLFEQALIDSKKWPEDLRLSFNLSAANLSSRGFILDFLRIMKKHNFDPKRLSCEVTETCIMWDFNETLSALETLKGSGVKLSLDDFGTGYSSLSHIHDLPLDCIKVDRQFVTGIAPNTNGYRIVKSLLALSRDMNVSCIVEGVETVDELDVLKEIGSDQVQGYLFSRPLQAKELSKLLVTGLGQIDSATGEPVRAIAN